MAEQTGIEWADSTFNPWIGCTKISDGCDFCYAETWAERWRAKGSKAEVWGPHAKRHRTAPAKWNEPRKWNRNAAAWRAQYGRPQFVFCASLADVFDNAVDPEWRADLWQLIRECDQLVWLILTKRPQNMAKMLPPDWGSGWPHVWLGTSVEHQEAADRNVPVLLSTPAAKRFLSCEPLIGPVDLNSTKGGTLWMGGQRGCDGRHQHHGRAGHVIHGVHHATDPRQLHHHHDESCGRGIDWVIAGGESGPNARPCHPGWPRALRDQCAAAGVPFLFKQWGDWLPAGQVLPGTGLVTGGTAVQPGRMRLHVTKSDTAERLHVYADKGVEAARMAGDLLAFRVGKHTAGRLLHGTTHDERPEA